MLKAFFEYIQPSAESSFLIRAFEVEAFEAPYHFHPEVELTLITKGSGQRYVGSSLAPYTAGDLVLLGSDLPHCWKSDNVKQGELNSASVVIQFPPALLGEESSERAELLMIRQLLQRSSQGIQFTGLTAATIAKQIQLLAATIDPFKRFIRLLEILQPLAVSQEYILLNTVPDVLHYTQGDHKRINEVTAYIVDNFRKDIALEEAAAIAKMSVSAFCKYYKRATRNTFIGSVLAYRINYAAQLLADSDKPVTDISYESGFRDVSHFYKSFRKHKKLSPLQYRKKFRAETNIVYNKFS